MSFTRNRRLAFRRQNRTSVKRKKSSFFPKQINARDAVAKTFSRAARYPRLTNGPPKKESAYLKRELLMILKTLLMRFKQLENLVILLLTWTSRNAKWLTECTMVEDALKSALSPLKTSSTNFIIDA
jgi:hypothetical protein